MVEILIVERRQHAHGFLQAELPDPAIEAKPLIGRAGEQQHAFRRPRAEFGERGEDLTHVLFGRERAEHAEHDGRGRDRMCLTKCLRRRGHVQVGGSFAQRHVLNRSVGPGALQVARKSRRMHGDQARGFHHASHHRPAIVKEPVERHRRQFPQMTGERRMVPHDFGAIVQQSSGGFQRRGPGVMQPAVMDNRQAGILKEVRPDVPVQMRIADLVDRQVVVPLPLTPYELMRAEDPEAARNRRGIGARRHRQARRIDVHVNRVPPRAKQRPKLRRPPRNPAPLRRPRRKPRKFHASQYRGRAVPYTSPVSQGEVAALIEETYAELHRLADGYVRREQHKSVQATELINEAFLRLAKGPDQHFQDRAHFIAIAAIAMRRLLVERARARAAAKRGGIQVQVTLDDALLRGGDESSVIDLVALDRALTNLARHDEQQARIVELRYFGGLSIEETADALKLSASTVKRDWGFARAWLLVALEGKAGA